MASLNKVTLIGNIGQAPEMRYTPNGTPVTTISIATTESWKDKGTGERREQTEWHRCEAWGKLAEIIGQYGEKGGQVFVEGALKTDKFTDKAGVERYSTKIRLSDLKFLGRRRDQGEGEGGQAEGGETSMGDTGAGDFDGMGDDAGGAPAAAPAPAPAPARTSPAPAAAGGGARAKFGNRSKAAG